MKRHILGIVCGLVFGTFIFVGMNRAFSGLNAIPFTEGEPDDISLSIKDLIESSPEQWVLTNRHGNHSYQLKRKMGQDEIVLDIANYAPFELGYTKVTGYIALKKGSLVFLDGIHPVARSAILELFEKLRPAVDAETQKKRERDINSVKGILSN